MINWIDLNKDFINNINYSGGDISSKGIESVKNSLRNIFSIRKGELPGDPKFGHTLDSYLFHLITPELNLLFQEDVRLLLSEYEPRIRLVSAKLEENPDYNEIHINLNFFIENYEEDKVFNLKVPFYQG